MVTKGTLEEALWASAGMNGTENFLNLKGCQIRRDDLADLTPRFRIATRSLQGTEQIDGMLRSMIERRKSSKGMREWRDGDALDAAFEEWVVPRHERHAQEPGTLTGQADKVWNEDLVQYLQDFKRHIGSMEKYNLSKEDLIKQVDELARERLTKVEDKVEKKREDMQRANVFGNVQNQERLQALRRSALWRNLTMHNIKCDLDAKFNRPVKRSEEQRTEHVLYEQFAESKETAVFKYCDTANTSGPKCLVPLRKGLADRFDNIYEAWAFLDTDGDWSMSFLEFKHGMSHMKIVGLDMDKIMSYLDKCVTSFNSASSMN